MFYHVKIACYQFYPYSPLYPSICVYFLKLVSLVFFTLNRVFSTTLQSRFVTSILELPLIHLTLLLGTRFESMLIVFLCHILGPHPCHALKLSCRQHDSNLRALCYACHHAHSTTSCMPLPSLFYTINIVCSSHSMPNKLIVLDSHTWSFGLR